MREVRPGGGNDGAIEISRMPGPAAKGQALIQRWTLFWRRPLSTPPRVVVCASSAVRRTPRVIINAR